MKILLCDQRERGLTLVELLVVMATITIFFFMLISGAEFSNAKPRAMRIQCVNNVNQIGLAISTWEGDHHDKYPWIIPGTNGGTMEFVAGPNEWRHFQVMSNELSTPKVLLCPGDDDSHSVAATNFNFFSNSNLSYFVGLDALDSDPQGLLSGDHSLTNGTAVRNGILELTTNSPAGWTAGIHEKSGPILLSDGSVQQMSRTGLRQAFLNTNSPTNHLQMPVLTP